MTPSGAIARLDASLARCGQTIALGRLIGTGPAAALQGDDVPIRAHVRTLRADEVVAGLTQNDLVVTLSPTAPAAWPFGMPRKGDKVIVYGAARNIELSKPFHIDDVLVRLELLVKG